MVVRALDDVFSGFGVEVPNGIKILDLSAALFRPTDIEVGLRYRESKASKENIRA